MKRHPLLIIISTIFVLNFLHLSSIKAQVAPGPKELAAAVDSIFADKSDMSKPGASVIILKGKEKILAKSYGSSNLAFGLPFNENTIFPLPYFSDQLVSFSVLQLEKKGLIKITDPINKYLPEFGFEDQILIAHLLNHSSDLPFLLSLRLMAGWKFSDPFYQNDFVNLTKNFTKGLKPDTRIGHSHGGIKILQMLIEKVAGMNFSQYAKMNIFQPLGMTSSLIKDEEFRDDKNISIGYDETESGFQRAHSIETAIICSMMYTTRNDFEKWMLNIEKKSFEKSIIEKMDQALAMNGVAQKRSNGSYCIGQQKYYEHLGEDEFFFIDSNEGHSWSWRRFPQSELSIMVIGNLDSYISDKLRAMVKILGPSSSTSSDTEEAESIPIELSEKELEAFTGIFWNEDYLYTTEISVVDGALYHSDKDNGFNFSMVPQTNTSFITPYGGIVEFSNMEEKNKRLKNITTIGSIYDSKQYEVPPLKEGDQLKYEGFYKSDKLNTSYSIVWEDQKLVLKRSRKPDLVLTPIGVNRFRAPEIDFRLIEFEENDKGTVQKMKLSTTILRGVEFQKL